MLVNVKMRDHFSIFCCQIKVFVWDVVWEAPFRHCFVLPMYFVYIFHFECWFIKIIKKFDIKLEYSLNFCRHVQVNINVDSRSSYIFIGNICIKDERIVSERLKYLVNIIYDNMIYNAFKSVKKLKIYW